MQPVTATQLLASARGEPDHEGSHRCFLCGGLCAGRHARADVVSDTFTAIATVAVPSSNVVCHGCALSMRVDKVPDATRPRGYRMVKPWQAQWVVAASYADSVSFDLHRLGRACLTPPSEPFAVALSTTLKKHLLYRTPVNRPVAVGTELFAVQLDDERAWYRVVDLAAALDVAKRLVASVGKLTLRDDPAPDALAASMARCGDWPARDVITLVERWAKLQGSALGRLAAFLCPSREVCRETFGLPKK